MKRAYNLLSFLVYYLVKLVQSNLYIAYDILTPRLHTNPGFVWVQLRTKSDLGILFYSNLLSMTPGTLSVDIAPDKDRILVHYLYKTTDEELIEQLEEIQNRIVKLIG